MRIAILAALAAVALAAPVRAAPVHNVEVVNNVDHPVPVTVQGTSAVTVTNTPSVTITNSPTVQLSPSATVQVGNSAAAPVPVRDVDTDARHAFQATVALDWSGTAATGVTIPAGKRLVIDFVSVDGAAQTAGPYIQPDVILYAALNGSPASAYYFQVAQSPIAPGQFGLNQPVKVYADQLQVSLAFSGYAPSFLKLNVSVSGHLVDL